MKSEVYHIIGLMSGTSLDGLDIAFCRFEFKEGRWIYQIIEAETVSYSDSWRMRLQQLDCQTAGELALADAELGHLMGGMVQSFIERHGISPLFIASHGQTIFHQPGRRLTTQIGKGAAIAAETGLPVVCDFRSLDVALGGQGAPLVPIGDRLLFPDYDYCLNLGGFANISYEQGNHRIAYDICPANLVLNALSGEAGEPFDENGEMARSGSLLPALLESLNNLPFYHHPPPKSLGKEWVDEHIWPLFNEFLNHESRGMRHKGTRIAYRASRIADLLNTFTEHIAIQVARNSGTDRAKKLLITGGGALNTYLVERIRHHSAPEVVLPDLQTIQFKEALIFAFLGLLRWRGEANALASVTGARRDNIGGAVYLP